MKIQSATQMEVIRLTDKTKWDKIVCSYKNHDIYYMHDYIESLLTSEQGKGVLLSFSHGNSAMCYPMIIKDISDDPNFSGVLPKSMLFDMETPYGYGGPLFDHLDEVALTLFKKELNKWCFENNIVSQFIRFNPITDNAVATKSFFDEVRYLHHTIYIDTTDKAAIMSNMDSKNRNMVRKALKNDIQIIVDKDLDSIEEFKKVYISTMDYHNASPMYYFPDEYYSYLKERLLDHTLLLRATVNDKTISAALFFYDDQFMHYHLSGTLTEYRHLASANLLLYSAAEWGNKHGCKLLHLGGGLSEDDSLFGFKKQFNKNGYADFSIGKTIFLPEQYKKLLALRKNLDDDFDINNTKMIQYRA